jgi:diguanylate cyclase (GGDEF)-like protein
MFDISNTSYLRVLLLTLAGTLLCITVAFLFDSIDLGTGTWRWGTSPVNNVVLPCILAAPLLYLLLSKQRQLTSAHQELIAVSSKDTLTQCLNRRAYTALVEGYLAALNSKDTKRGALLIIDVDYFKSVNDRFGHDKGDQALRVIGNAIKASVEATDLVARIGGEEFSVFMPDADEDIVVRRSEFIRSKVADADFNAGNIQVPLSVSVGAVLVESGVTFGDVYRAADQMMYKAKAEGRNRVIVAGFGQRAA